MTEIRDVKLLRNGQIENWRLELEATPAPKLRLVTSFGQVHYTSAAPDFFDCLCALRREHLEPMGVRILCNGARQDVYPSRMCRQMSGGRQAYALTLGTPAHAHTLLDIFEPAPEGSAVVTVAEQQAFYQRWLASLG